MRTPESYQSATFQSQKEAVLDEVDYFSHQKKAEIFFKNFHTVPSWQQWNQFCNHLNASQDKTAEKFLLQELVFQCFEQPLAVKELAQLITLASYFKSVYGLELYRRLLEAEVPDSERRIADYLAVMQLLINLQDVKGISSLLKSHLPDLQALRKALQSEYGLYLEKRYPNSDIDTVLERFATADEFTANPLPAAVLQRFKPEYLGIRAKAKTLEELSQNALKTSFLEAAKRSREQQDNEAKQIMIAVIIETLRRFFKISPYDTQIMALLALIGQEETDIKGWIAQIRTGEGKSTISAMLVAFLAGQGHFVDVITSSSVLAIRDYRKYAEFFEALGISSSHISRVEQKQAHFHAQVLFGTNWDYEFAQLRDGLNKEKLRFSYNLNGELVPRTHDAAVVDEVDNLLLNTTGAARISYPGKDDLTWIYAPILKFTIETVKAGRITPEHISKLRNHLGMEFNSPAFMKELRSLSDTALSRWIKSAQIAYYYKKEGRDYIIQADDIRIVDYSNTGSISEGCQWQHGIHQMLQARHQLKITPQSLMVASISHPSMFNEYQLLFGLTGTMGEKIEREEVQDIYKIKSFDVPPHFPCQRKTLPPRILDDIPNQYLAIYQRIQEMQALNRPVLVLFESIAETERFNAYLVEKGINSQLLNETQRESGEYIIARAGQERMVTIATNIAGRGTDIILSPGSKAAGGLHFIFTFHPEDSRVQEQGDGRSARQGEPGSSEMILQAKDPNILTLLSNQSLDSLVKNWLKGTNEEKINFLRQLRNEQTERHSKERRYSSKLETMLYSVLKEFFSKLQEIREDFDTLSQEEWQQSCQINAAPSQGDPLVHSPAWHSLCNRARILLGYHSEGKAVDWSSFIEQYKQLFIESINEEWASFYSTLDHTVRDMDLKLAEKTIQENFAKLNLARMNKESAFAGLSHLLYQASLPQEEAAKKVQSGFFSLKPRELYDKAVAHYKLEDYQTAFNYCVAAKESYEQNKGSDLELGYCYSVLGSCNAKKNLIPESINAFEKALSLFYPLNNNKEHAELLKRTQNKFNDSMNLGKFDFKFIYDKAVKNYQAEAYVVAVYQLLYLISYFPGQAKDERAICYSTLASCYNKLKQSEEADAACIEGIKLAKEAGKLQLAGRISDKKESFDAARVSGVSAGL
ncbi:hypothetical protein B1207_08430 [Legionella quinlivanii]|uniref:Uncharacterized protein n=1 Tax=Legionella quinlivanii TaxID=45073 RepID=A0A364LIC2_9GAMM|nr:hypothetical protein [Legionella quinlivanii]RAP36171.1 hypothetical protein B1207_08430 [Legionella quinlivanii]